MRGLETVTDRGMAIEMDLAIIPDSLRHRQAVLTVQHEVKVVRAAHRQLKHSSNSHERDHQFPGHTSLSKRQLGRSEAKEDLRARLVTKDNAQTVIRVPRVRRRRQLDQLPIYHKRLLLRTHSVQDHERCQAITEARPIRPICAAML